MNPEEREHFDAWSKAVELVDTRQTLYDAAKKTWGAKHFISQKMARALLGAKLALEDVIDRIPGERLNGLDD